jgi:hypothetical protein
MYRSVLLIAYFVCVYALICARLTVSAKSWALGDMSHIRSLMVYRDCCNEKTCMYLVHYMFAAGCRSENMGPFTKFIGFVAAMDWLICVIKFHNSACMMQCAELPTARTEIVVTRKQNCDSHDLCLCHSSTCISLRKRLKKNRYVAYTDRSCYCDYFTFVNVDSIFTSSYLHVQY